MCGIAGIVVRGGPIEGDVVNLSRTLGAALAHRGPDGEGAWLSPARDVLLVHRRLAIIDPAPEGAQPMAIESGHLMVFNGEIYNYRELRRELASRGERFTTESDTEVLLRLVAMDGPAALARVRGMFALACWNPRERSLLLARDRFGIKPLYVAATAGQIAFASELNALTAARLVADSPSPAGVLAFLRWGSVPPPLTWRRGAVALAPGSWWIWRQAGGEKRGTFADIRAVYRSDERHAISEAAFRCAIGDAVRDSVRAHLVSDVPVGIFLSGGIDSSAIVSAATSTGAARLQTFTVGFDDATSEAVHARTVAEAFATDHHELRVDAPHVVDDLPQILARLDQPTIDAVNSFYVSRAVASTGIKTVLSGTGGDELFGGYPSFLRLPRAMAIKRAIGSAWPLVARVAGSIVPARLRARWRRFAATDGDLADAYRIQRGFLLPNEVADLVGEALREPSIWADAAEEIECVERLLVAPTGEETDLAGVARLETRVYLTSQLLRDIDVMAMAHGLEVRVPFVDHELASAVWPELGFHRSLLTRKRLLFDSLQRPLPDTIVQRPKQGFTLPFAQWIGGELAPFVRDGMQRLAEGGWIVADAPARVWSDWQSGAVHWTRPWGLAVLGHFLSRAA